jgi:hypothetical protein
MKRVIVKYRFILCRAGLLLAMASCFSSVSLQAGDKIVFGNDKSKLNPEDKSLSSKEAAKLLNKVNSDPLKDAMTLQPSSSEPLDPRKEKDRRLKRLEQMNWMFVEEGELTGENKDSLSGPEEDLSSILDKKDDNDFMFRDKDKNSSPGSASKGYGGKKDKSPQLRAVTGSEDNSISSRSLVNSTDKTASKSMHTDEVLNFKSLFDTSSSGNSSDKAGAAMGGLFRTGSSTLSSAQKNSREEYKSFLSGSEGLSSTAIKGISSDVPKAGGASANPLFPKAADSVTRTPGTDPYAMGGSRYAGRTESQGSWNNFGGVSGFGTLQPANLNTRTPASTGFEPAPSRARGMGSLGGH